MARLPTERKRIRVVRWEGVAMSDLARTAGTIGKTAVASDTEPSTIMRTRGELIIYLSTANAPGIFARYGFGISCVPEGTGATVLRSPLTDQNAPWFVYHAGHLGYDEMVTDVVQAHGLSGHRVQIDSKAMRKCPPDVEVQAVLELVTIDAAATINWAFVGRILMGR